MVKEFDLDGFLAGFTGSDANHFCDLGNKDFAITDAPGFGGG